jgi:hypothetical protein
MNEREHLPRAAFWKIAGTSPAARLGLLLVLILGAITLTSSSAQETKPETAAPLTELRIIEKIRAATDKGLDWLEQKQVKQGAMAGSWSANNAMNALSILAFLSSGHVPGRGKYAGGVEGGVLTRAKKYLLKTGRQDGYISSSSMYEHGLSTLALAELYGMDPDPELEDKLRKAVDLIVRCQSPAGGWRYNPVPNDQDLSVSVMQIVGLRAANNAGIPVPQKTLENAVKYVQNCSPPDGPGFAYSGAGAGPQTTPAGILSLQLLGHPNDKRIPRSLDYLATLKPDWPGPVQYFYYHHYYAIQAMYQAGGKHWNDWHPKIRELLLSKQNQDGSWDVPPGSAEAAYGQPYATPIAILVLNIYLHYLPAYQR